MIECSIFDNSMIREFFLQTLLAEHQSCRVKKKESEIVIIYDLERDRIDKKIPSHSRNRYGFARANHGLVDHLAPTMAALASSHALGSPIFEQGFLWRRARSNVKVHTIQE